MTHYICTGGCEGKSGNTGTCQAEGCTKHNKPLTPCHCEDGKHGGAFDTDTSDNDGFEE